MTAILSLREMKMALGGEISGGQVLAPGPGHSPQDRSLSVTLSATGQLVVNSFAGDDWRVCREYVLNHLGLAPDIPNGRSDPLRRSRREPTMQRPGANEGRRQARVGAWKAIWEAGRDPRGTLAEIYLNGRGLELPAEAANEAIHFHPACPFNGETHPAMICLVRNILSNEPQAIHRTALTADGKNVKSNGKNLRYSLGPIKAGAIKLDDDAGVDIGIAIGEGVETCLTARREGLRPVWSVISAGGIEDFPVLPSIDGLHLLAENGTNARAIEKCGRRWREAGRQVIVVEPFEGSDLNDALRLRASI